MTNRVNVQKHNEQSAQTGCHKQAFFCGSRKMEDNRKSFLGKYLSDEKSRYEAKAKQDCLIMILKGEDNYSGTKSRYGILSRETMSEREQYRKAVGTAQQK